MRKLERVLLITSVLMAVINLFGVPGTAIFMTISYCSLAFTYILIGVLSLGKLGIGLIITKPTVVESTSDDSIFPSIKRSDSSVFNPVGWKRKVALSLVCYCLSIMAIAILFRMSYWPGSSLMLTVGILQSVIAFIILLIKQIIKPSLFYRHLLLRVSIFSLVCFSFIILPERFFIDIKYRNNPEILHQISNDNANK